MTGWRHSPMTSNAPPPRPTLAYAASPARLTPRDFLWALLPSAAVLVAGVALFLGIARWLRLRYGPYAITQWTANARQVEFWACDLPFCGWLVLWAVTLAAAVRRCPTRDGWHLAVLVALGALVVGVFSFATIMEEPFP